MADLAGSLVGKDGSQGRRWAGWGARGRCSPCSVPRWLMPGCTPAWPRALLVKLRGASGSGFKVGVSGWGAGEGGRMEPIGAGPCLIPSLLPTPAPPNIIGPRGPRSVVGLAPGQLVLECSVEADPAPKIEWHRDGILLQVGARLGTLGHLLLRLQTPSRLALRGQGPALCQHSARLPSWWSPPLLSSPRVTEGDLGARLRFARRTPDTSLCSSCRRFEPHCVTWGPLLGFSVLPLKREVCCCRSSGGSPSS